MPRLEVNFEQVAANATLMVERAAERGITVTGVTKAMLGHQQLADTLLAAGVASLGDSRLDSIEKMQEAGQTCPMFLLRSPAPSEVSRVVEAGVISLNTEIEVVEQLAAVARAHGVVHSIIVMVELGDLREGVMPDMLQGWMRRALALRNIEVVGIGANLACRSGVAPDESNMSQLSECATRIEQTWGIALKIVSGGNSASVTWAFAQATSGIGRVNNLRLGEAILLGRDPLTRDPIAGASTDAFTLVGEVIESVRKPKKPWGRVHQAAFGEVLPSLEHGDVWQTIVALGHQDTDPTGLTPPPGVAITAASSDHLITETDCRTDPGTHIRFQVNYSALLRAATCPFVSTVVVG